MGRPQQQLRCPEARGSAFFHDFIEASLARPTCRSPAAAAAAREEDEEEEDLLLLLRETIEDEERRTKAYLSGYVCHYYSSSSSSSFSFGREVVARGRGTSANHQQQGCTTGCARSSTASTSESKQQQQQQQQPGDTVVAVARDVDDESVLRYDDVDICEAFSAGGYGVGNLSGISGHALWASASREYDADDADGIVGTKFPWPASPRTPSYPVTN